MFSLSQNKQINKWTVKHKETEVIANEIRMMKAAWRTYLKDITRVQKQTNHTSFSFSHGLPVHDFLPKLTPYPVQAPSARVSSAYVLSSLSQANSSWSCSWNPFLIHIHLSFFRGEAICHLFLFPLFFVFLPLRDVTRKKNHPLK